MYNEVPLKHYKCSAGSAMLSQVSTTAFCYCCFWWLACMPCSSNVESGTFPALAGASVSGEELQQQESWQEQAKFLAGLMEPCKHGIKVRQQEKARQGETERYVSLPGAGHSSWKCKSVWNVKGFEIKLKKYTEKLKQQ